MFSLIGLKRVLITNIFQKLYKPHLAFVGLLGALRSGFVWGLERFRVHMGLVQGLHQLCRIAPCKPQGQRT